MKKIISKDVGWFIRLVISAMYPRLLILLVSVISLKADQTIPRFYVLDRSLFGEANNVFGGLIGLSVYVANQGGMLGTFTKENGNSYPFIYDGGVWVDLREKFENMRQLGFEWDGWLAEPIDINDFGQVVGYYSVGSPSNTRYRLFTYSSGLFTLPTPDGADLRSIDVNGFLRISNYGPNIFFQSPHLWTPSSFFSWCYFKPSGWYGSNLSAYGLDRENFDVLSATTTPGEYGLFILTVNGPIAPVGYTAPLGEDGQPGYPILVSKSRQVLWSNGFYSGASGRLPLRLGDDTRFTRSQEASGLILCHSNEAVLWRPDGENDWCYPGSDFVFYDPNGNLGSDVRGIRDDGSIVTSDAIWKPSPPILIEPVQDVIGRYGDVARVEPRVVGAQSYTWYRAGTVVTTGLTLTGTLSPDNSPATYRLVAKNVSGELSINVRVQIYAPATIETAPVSAEICESTEARFSVTTSGVPAPQLQWLFNNQRIQGETNSTLVIPQAGLPNEGFYSVRAMNSEGTNTSVAAALTVLSAPRIFSAPGNRSVESGKRVTFNISASGSGTLSYEWALDGKKLSNINGSELLIESASRTNAGTYVVTVRNSCGEMTTDPFALDVLPPPPELKNPRLFMGFNLVGELGRTYEIQFKADVAATDWTLLKRITLETASYLFIDDGAANSHRVYRAVLVP